jgi:hypothetical protein
VAILDRESCSLWIDWQALPASELDVRHEFLHVEIDGTPIGGRLLMASGK